MAAPWSDVLSWLFLFSLAPWPAWLSRSGRGQKSLFGIKQLQPGGQRCSRARRGLREPGRLSGQPDDAGQPVALPQGEQSLCLHGPGPDRCGGHGLAPVDPVVIAPWPDLRPLCGERGPHDVGQSAVEILARPVQFLQAGAVGLRRPQVLLGRPRLVEEVVEPPRQGNVGVVLGCRLRADRRTLCHHALSLRHPEYLPGTDSPYLKPAIVPKVIPAPPGPRPGDEGTGP